ncbi:MAG TPA: sodium pump decarboxylase subunit gamma [Clostridiales bacterium]|nr:sodium pump decarboxylase subunit gamma [Clostridiales bacterium]
MEDDEFIAVITAAIAASLKRTAHSIIVRSIQQTPTTSPVWNRAARYDLTANKL